MTAVPLSRVHIEQRATDRALSLPLGGIMGALLALFTLDNMLLLGFLGHSLLLVSGLAMIVPAAVGMLTARAFPAGPRISLQTLLICFLVAILLLLLGGEGRLFFTTEDWQIRDAVLRDMGTHRWPFDYWLEGHSQMLRAPLGMYLAPALLGAGSQIARDWALLAHNSLVLGLLFATGSVLFTDRRSRIVALIVFVMFSGLDVIGYGLVTILTGAADWDHLERWANNYQYSAHITQLFWVPQHAFAGWTCALGYLLWRRGLAPVGVFGATIPLVALWSPLAIMGAVPFALFAGLSVLRSKAWGGRDILLCALAMATAIPALLYLQADAAAVGSGFRPPAPAVYALILLLEVAPFIMPLWRERAPMNDRATLLIVAGCLILMPAWAIGASTDFQMRASIMPLAILAIAFAGWVLRLERRDLKLLAAALLALGAMTGAAEILRALRLAPSPAPLCSLAGVWTQQSGFVVPNVTYFAGRSAMPGALVPGASQFDRAAVDDPARCWERPWRTTRSMSS